MFELERTGDLVKLLDGADVSKIERVSQYLTASSTYQATKDEREKMLKIVYDINMKHPAGAPRYTEALRIGLKLNKKDMIMGALDACEDKWMKVQMGYVLRQSRYFWIADESGDEELEKATRGQDWMQGYFQCLAEKLDVKEPKLPEDIYKSHLEEKKTAQAVVLDSAKQNL